MNSEIFINDLINVDKQIIEYSEQFVTYARKTAENYLNLCRIVYECKSSLNSNADFNKFCTISGIDPNSSTVRKYLVVWKKFDFLIKNVSSLPKNWTTIYEVSKLNEDDITSLISENKLNENTRFADIKKDKKKKGRNEQSTQEPPTQGPEDIKIECGTAQNIIVKMRFCTITINEYESKNELMVKELIQSLNNIDEFYSRSIPKGNINDN